MSNNLIIRVMKKQLLTLMVAFVLPSAIQAQQIAYSYDAAGNRIGRSLANGINQAPRKTESENNGSDRLQRSLSVGPNPTSGLLAVKHSRWDDSDECRLQITTLSGQVLIEQNMTSAEATLDLSTYPNGYYLLSVELNDEQKTYKIIKK